MLDYLFLLHFRKKDSLLKCKMEDKNGVSAEHEDSLNTLTMEQDDSTSEENDSQVLKRQLKETQLALSRCQRQLEKSQQYNEELRQQIENLSSELHVFRSAAQRQQDAEVQVVEKDIAEGMTFLWCLCQMQFVT